jgi:ribosomal protein L37AE/L43A
MDALEALRDLAKRPEQSETSDAVATPTNACEACAASATRRIGDAWLCASCAAQTLDAKSIKAAAREYLSRKSLVYARLHEHGATVAAMKGDTRPAEWALLHSRTVDPIDTDTAAGPKVAVTVGFVLPGLPGSVSPMIDVSPTPEQIEGETLPKTLG